MVRVGPHRGLRLGDVLGLAAVSVGAVLGPYATAWQLTSGVSPPVEWYPWVLSLSAGPWYALMGLGWALYGIGAASSYCSQAVRVSW